MEKINKYVGLRYVPKIMGEWDKTKEYEPLMIVTYQGNSYTSKTFIPVGIDIQNESFWCLTGNYNAQIENMRTEFNNNIEEINRNIDTNETKNQKNYEELKTNSETLENNINGFFNLNYTELLKLQNTNITFNSISNTFSYQFDCKETLQNIINNSKVLMIPRGKYYISDTIEINSPITILSDGAEFYINPNEINKSAFKITSDNVEINNISIISKNVYTPKIDSNLVTGKSSNIYAFLIRGNNININNCNSNECFSIAYVRGYDKTYDNTETKIINNINLTNLKALNCVFGIFTAFVNNVQIEKCELNNATDLNLYCHNIYIGTESTNLNFNNINLTGGSSTMNDVISLHDSITQTTNIKNITFTNCISTCKAINFITLSDCKNVNIINCNHENYDLNYQKGLIVTEREVRQIKIKLCTFKLHCSYSLINSIDGGINVSDFLIQNCNFILRDTNTNIFRYMRSIRLLDSNFNLISTQEKRVNFFFNDSEIVKTEKNIVFSGLNILGDTNTSIDNIISCNSSIDDTIIINECNVINNKKDTRVIDLQQNYNNTLVIDCNFYGYNEICDSTKTLNMLNVNVK